jgi:hypothetical protein
MTSCVARINRGTREFNQQKEDQDGATMSPQRDPHQILTPTAAKEMTNGDNEQEAKRRTDCREVRR